MSYSQHEALRRNPERLSQVEREARRDQTEAQRVAEVADRYHLDRAGNPTPGTKKFMDKYIEMINRLEE